MSNFDIKLSEIVKKARKSILIYRAHAIISTIIYEDYFEKYKCLKQLQKIQLQILCA